MDPLEKEARIRLYMEKIRKEEEEANKKRLSDEKKILEDKAQKELEQEIIKSSKNRVALEKIQGYLKANDWVKVIEQMNECLFERGYKRMLETRDTYSKRNKDVGEAIIKELSGPFDSKFDKSYVEKIICNDNGISLTYEERDKCNSRKNCLSGLKSFEKTLERFASFSNNTFFYYEVFAFVRKHIIELLKRYDYERRVFYSF
jgi:hypothetical protein